MNADQPIHMLEGYRVWDFTQAVAGPNCTLMLAEKGAEVIKVELAPSGDLTRGAAVIKDGRCGYFVQHNRGRNGICADVKRPGGLNLIKEMIPRMDVIVENFAPGVVGRLGLGYAAVDYLIIERAGGHHVD
jgi:crotonobetainyl-CoA:carnitine CoA-transferase CaiB-like acyl-CoA transferase